MAVIIVASEEGISQARATVPTVLGSFVLTNTIATSERRGGGSRTYTMWPDTHGCTSKTSEACTCTPVATFLRIQGRQC